MSQMAPFVRAEDDAKSVHAVEVRNLTKRYGRTLALDGINLEIERGEMFALLGPNGAGKTTLLHILCTILQPDSGSAKIVGFDVVREAVKARRNIGVVFQEPSLDDRLTAEENLNFHGLVYQIGKKERRRRIDEMLELVELEDWRHSQVRTFSSGMKRRLEIGRALLHQPSILFLDEPTVGLDAQSRERIWDYMRELRTSKDVSIVVTTHYIEEVENCDRLCIIDHGKILTAGSPGSLRSEHGTEVVRIMPRGQDVFDAILKVFPTARPGDGGMIVIPGAGREVLDELLREFGTQVSQVSLDQPSLESVFLSLTGRELRDNGVNEQQRSLIAGRRARRS